MANRPLGLTEIESFALLMVASASEAKAVIPTTVPAATFSSTALAARLVSSGVETANSLTSLMAMEKVFAAVEPSAEVAVTSMAVLAPMGSEERRGGVGGRPVVGAR